MKQVSEQEIAGVLATDGAVRYEHFVKQVADWELVWGLRDDGGWVSMADSDERRTFPVWPHEVYAKLCATGEWSGMRPTSIEVHEWVDDWLPEMDGDGVLIAVFPTPKLKGVIVDARRLLDDIQAELSLME